MTKIQEEYLDDALMALLDHSKRVQDDKKKLKLKNLVKIGCTITMFYIQCVT